MFIGNRVLQKGVALLTALLVTALAATIATAIAVNQRLLIDQSQMLINSDRLYLSLQGVQDWAISEIMNSAIQGYSPGILVHSVFPKTTLDGIEIEGFAIDQQGLYNVNILQQTQNEPNFLSLLAANGIQGQQDVASEITAWVGYSNVLDLKYLELHPPYRPAHRLMANPSELRAVLDVNQRLYLKLLPSITALPTNENHINLNTAAAPVLMSIDPTVSAEAASSLISCRNEIGIIQKPQDLQSCVNSNPAANALGGVLTDTSDYFLVRGFAKIGKQQLTLTSLLKLVRVNNMVKVDILWQQIG